MKKFLACFVLAVFYVLITTYEIFLIQAYTNFLCVVDLAYLMLMYVGGFVIVGALLLPVTYGAKLTIDASNAIFPSSDGKRYMIFSAIITGNVVITLFALFFSVGGFSTKATLQIPYPCYLMLIYCAMMWFFSIKYYKSVHMKNADGHPFEAQ